MGGGRELAGGIREGGTMGEVAFGGSGGMFGDQEASGGGGGGRGQEEQGGV